MTSIEKLRTQFGEVYQRDCRVFSAPGRVNLIGEHTDYNDGFVLPMAIDRRTYVAAAARQDRIVRCNSNEFAGQVEFSLSADLQPSKDWSNLIRGMAASLIRVGYDLCGADLLVESEVPIGSGLSSSAALEVAAGFAFLNLSSDLPIDPIDLALAAQRAEQDFTGTQCGIMDQFVACLAVQDHALLIDCRSLEYDAVQLGMNEARIVVCNTMVKHDLSSGEYNRRRAECQEAVRQLAVYLREVESLRDVDLEKLDGCAATLPEMIGRRSRHVITENRRTLNAVQALKTGDLGQFGQLMYASHESLSRDYEVSCPELDLLVELASNYPGVFGARMTGGGFGGCTVNLVKADEVDHFVESVATEYEKETGKKPEYYICQPSEGMKEEN
ncbi:MAG: galactokinase [Acidobacteria bacterium]|nr:galactokinase [Acidobacteriota bacterium]